MGDSFGHGVVSRRNLASRGDTSASAHVAACPSRGHVCSGTTLEVRPAGDSAGIHEARRPAGLGDRRPEPRQLVGSRTGRRGGGAPSTWHRKSPDKRSACGGLPVSGGEAAAMPLRLRVVEQLSGRAKRPCSG